MKRTVFIVVLLVLSIGIPVLAESSDSLSTESENLVLQKQELKLPWYKNLNYTLGYNNDSSLLTSGSPSKDTLKGKGIPFWRKLDYGIGYSGGLCYTGRDLMKYTDWDPLAFMNPSNYLYYLNSIEVSAIYPLEKGKGIEVGMGYGWARIEKYSNVFYKFHLFPIWIGYIHKKLTLRLSYIYSYSPQYYYRYGYRASGIFQINKLLYFHMDMGNVWLTGRSTGNHISLCLNGIGFIIGYNFTPKGGVK